MLPLPQSAFRHFRAAEVRTNRHRKPIRTRKSIKSASREFSDHPSLDNCRNGLAKGLENKGFKDDDNIKLEYVGAQDDMSKNTQIASNFAAENLDLVCGIATPSAQALYAACLDKKIPVIFNAVSDPVAAKLAESDTKPLPE